MASHDYSSVNVMPTLNQFRCGAFCLFPCRRRLLFFLFFFGWRELCCRRHANKNALLARPPIKKDYQTRRMDGKPSPVE